jgi:hypothetical protein
MGHDIDGACQAYVVERDLRAQESSIRARLGGQAGGKGRSAADADVLPSRARVSKSARQEFIPYRVMLTKIGLN